MLKPNIIIGGGGHAKVLIEVLRLLQLPVLGIVDPSPTLTSVLGIPVLGDDLLLERYSPDEIILVNGLGSLEPESLRMILFKKYKDRGFNFNTLIHPSAILAKTTCLGEGVQIMAGSIVQPDCVIGDNSIINTRTSIDHDVRIGAHVHLAPGVTLSGHVQVRDKVHIGTGASLIQGIDIGEASMIAAGTVVIRDCPSYSHVMGVPGKEVKKREVME